MKYSISFSHREVYQNFVFTHFIAPLKGRPDKSGACSIRAAPNPHMPMPGQRLADALLKHADVSVSISQGVDSIIHSPQKINITTISL